MKLTLCTAVTFFLAVSLVYAQQPGGPRPQPQPEPAGTTVALIDIKAVFQNHTRFKAALDDMKKDVKAYESSLGQQKKDAMSLNEKMGNFRVGSPEYKQIEGQLVQMTTESQIGMQLKRKEFLDREARIYYHAYMEVVEHVKDHALRNRLSLVMAHNSTQIDPTNPSSIFEGVNRPVVYQQVVDITPVIIERLNRGTPPENVSARPQIPTKRR